MKVTFLGTNGWYDTPTGNTPSIFIETKEAYIIFDAGFGFQKARALIKDSRPIHLFISHLHLDHLIGLHTLPLFKFPQGIDIYTAKGEEKAIRALLNRPFSTPPLLLPSKIRFRDIAKTKGLPFGMKYAKLRHVVPCVGFCIEENGSSVAYCTDTGSCNNLKRLAAGADLFIAECAMAPGDRSPSLFHITPETAARVAKEAGAKKLALCHFDPGKYPAMEHRAIAERAARAIFPDSIAAHDGLTIEV